MALTVAEGSYLLGLSRQEGKIVSSSYLGIRFPYFLLTTSKLTSGRLQGPCFKRCSGASALNPKQPRPLVEMAERLAMFPFEVVLSPYTCWLLEGNEGLEKKIMCEGYRGATCSLLKSKQQMSAMSP